MSKTFLIALMTLAAGPIVHPPVSNAAEKQTICTTPNVADAGYTIIVSTDYKSAVVTEESFVGNKKIADMTCQVLPTHSFPDSLDNYLVCNQVNPSRAPLIARFYAGGIGGFHYASLRTSIGKGDGPGRESEIQFGHLECR